MSEAKQLDAPSSGARRFPRGFEPALGAILWLGLFALRLVRVPSDWWLWRDDAVITLSHARGWTVDGAVSVSTTGARVEGFSTPLQFFVSAVYYRLGFTSYEHFLNAQVVLCVALTGFFAVRIVQGSGYFERPVGRLGVVGAAAILCLVPWAFVGWTASGMEGALVVVTMFASCAGFIRLSHGTGRAEGAIYAGAAIALLGLTRVEYTILAMPLVLLAVACSLRNSRRCLATVVLIPLVSWTAVHAWRWQYFGSFWPNTVAAQGKDPTVFIRSWAPAVLMFIGAVAVVGLVLLALGLILRKHFSLSGVAWNDSRLWAVVGAVAAVAFVVTEHAVSSGWVRTPETWTAVTTGTVELGLLGLALLLAAGLLTLRGNFGVTELSLALVAAMPLVQLVVSGPARLDPVRIASAAFAPLALLATVVLGRAIAGWRTDLASGASRIGFTAASAVFTVAGAWWFAVHADIAEARNLCCKISPIDEAITERAEEHQIATGLTSVIVANPDLGKLSHRRQFEIVDVGLLGDPLLQRIANDEPRLRDVYLRDIATPDVVELHPGWTCQYRSWLTWLQAEYEVVEVTPFVDTPDLACLEPIEWRILVRDVDDPAYQAEIELSQAFTEAGDAPELARTSIDVCGSRDGSPLRCEYVRRSVQRNRTLIREVGQWDAVVAAFDRSPAAALDQALLGADSTPQWQDGAFDALVDLADEHDLRRPT